MFEQGSNEDKLFKPNGNIYSNSGTGPKPDFLNLVIPKLESFKVTGSSGRNLKQEFPNTQIPKLDLANIADPPVPKLDTKPVIFKCGTQEIIISRKALCRASKKFSQISRNIDPNKEWEISVTSAPVDIVTKLLEYVQTSSPTVFKGLSNATMFRLVSLSHAMEMNSIETEICGVILQNASSYCSIAYLWDLAQKYNNDKAIQEIVRFTQNHMNDMITKGFFKAITWEQVCVLMTRLVREKIPLDNLCLAIIQWLNMDPARKWHAPLVARHLDWQRLSTDFVCQLVFTEPMFRRILKNSIQNKIWNPPMVVQSALIQYKQCHLKKAATESENTVQNTLEDAWDKHKLDSYSEAWLKNLKVEQLTNALKSVSCFKQAISKPAFLLVGVTRYNSLAMQVYFVESRSWADPVDINMQHRCGFGCAYHRKLLYIIGGDRGDGYVFETFFAVNVFNYKIEELVSFLHPRCYAGVALTGSDLYVLGGLNDKQEAVSVARKVSLLDEEQIWKPIKNMKEKRVSPGVTVDPYGQIIVIGGHCCSCEYFNKVGWVDMSSLPETYKNYGMHAAYSNQQVYSFRDFRPSEVCQFDMTKEGLTIKAISGTPPNCITSMCVYGGEIWMLSPRGTIFIYYIATNNWKKTYLRPKELSNYYYLTIIDQDDVRTFENKLKSKDKPCPDDKERLKTQLARLFRY